MKIKSLSLFCFIAAAILLSLIPCSHAYTEVSILHLNEGSGNTVSNDYTWTIGDTEEVTWIAGKESYGLNFSGSSGSYLTTPYNAAFDLQTFSIAMWFSASSEGDWGSLYSRDDYVDSKDWGVWLLIRPTGYIFFRIWAGDGTPGTSILIEGDVDLRDDEWHHVAATYNGTTIQLFIDTDLVGSNTWAATIGYQPNKPTIGASPNLVNRFEGRIDEFYLTSDVLTDEEIEDLFDDNDPQTAQENISENIEFAAVLMAGFWIVVFFTHIIIVIQTGKSQYFFHLMLGYTVAIIILLVFASVVLTL